MMSTLKASENLRQIGEWGVFRAERRRWAAQRHSHIQRMCQSDGAMFCEGRPVTSLSAGWVPGPQNEFHFRLPGSADLGNITTTHLRSPAQQAASWLSSSFRELASLSLKEEQVATSKCTQASDLLDSSSYLHQLSDFRAAGA